MSAGEAIERVLVTVVSAVLPSTGQIEYFCSLCLHCVSGAVGKCQPSVTQTQHKVDKELQDTTVLISFMLYMYLYL